SALFEGKSPFPSSASEPNGIAEPGETFSFAPSWKNTSDGTVVGTTGSITSFTGPTGGGAAYTVADGTASYGDIAPGATASASSGYRLQATASSRPQPHWDATVTESLNTSETRAWTVHIGKSFGDVGTANPFYSDVEAIFHHNITTGTSTGVYSPDANTARDAMTAFIARAHAGSDAAVPASGTVSGLGSYDCVSGGTSLFSDIAPDALFCRHVHWAAAHGLTFGCTDAATFTSKFCPVAPITRRSMAVMLARDLAGGDSVVPAKAPDPGNGRAYDCTDGKPNAFADVPESDPGCKYVYALWSKGIVDGYQNGDYGPNDSVTRGQMAKFLTNSYALTLP
ncbi:MAG TPA: S-layer homology domain-containing protein, partial [Thermoanaerobaculia bacterium]|nr:S-layer homology domain-containing protein [Thermoanaerobaculia bacterium]